MEIELNNSGSEHPDVANSYNSIGNMWYNKGDYDQAIKHYELSLDSQIKSNDLQSSGTATNYFNIALSWEQRGDFQKALEFYKKCLSIQLNVFESKNESVATTYLYIGICYKEMLNYYESIESFKSGFENQKKGGYPFRIAECYEALYEYKNAFEYYLQSAEIRKDDPDAGIEDESTQQSIKACIRLAQELKK